jgi:hypothetical protein
VERFGQVVDDFSTPDGRCLVVWDFQSRATTRVFVPTHSQIGVGQLVAMQSDSKIADVRTIVSVMRRDVPAAFHDEVLDMPIAEPFVSLERQSGGTSRH